MHKEEWLQLEQTKEFKRNLLNTKRELEERLGDGETVNGDVEATALATAKFTGCIYAINLILETLE